MVLTHMIKDKLDCDKAVDAMAAYLASKGAEYEIIVIKYPTYPGLVISITKEAIDKLVNNHENGVVSTNGFHTGIVYKNTAFCNVHPAGMPVAAWLNDFDGIGEPIITPSHYQRLKR